MTLSPAKEEPELLDDDDIVNDAPEFVEYPLSLETSEPRPVISDDTSLGDVCSAISVSTEEEDDIELLQKRIASLEEKVRRTAKKEEDSKLRYSKLELEYETLKNENESLKGRLRKAVGLLEAEEEYSTVLEGKMAALQQKSSTKSFNESLGDVSFYSVCSQLSFTSADMFGNGEESLLHFEPSQSAERNDDLRGSTHSIHTSSSRGKAPKGKRSKSSSRKCVSKTRGTEKSAEETKLAKENGSKEEDPISPNSKSSKGSKPSSRRKLKKLSSWSGPLSISTHSEKSKKSCSSKNSKGSRSRKLTRSTSRGSRRKLKSKSRDETLAMHESFSNTLALSKELFGDDSDTERP